MRMDFNSDICRAFDCLDLPRMCLQEAEIRCNNSHLPASRFLSIASTIVKDVARCSNPTRWRTQVLTGSALLFLHPLSPSLSHSRSPSLSIYPSLSRFLSLSLSLILSFYLSSNRLGLPDLMTRTNTQRACCNPRNIRFHVQDTAAPTNVLQALSSILRRIHKMVCVMPS